MIYGEVSDHILDKWEAEASLMGKHYVLPRDWTFPDLFGPATENLGLHREVCLEFYLGIYTSYDASKPDMPEEYIKVLNTLAGSAHPHVLLKVYRLQRGLEP